MKSNWDNEKTNSKLTDLTPTKSIITLNVNELNMPFKRQRLSDWSTNYMLSTRNML